MRLLEYKGKELLNKYGVKIPRGAIVKSPEDVQTLKALKFPLFAKSQVPFAGRAKMGLVRRVDTIKDAENAARDYLGKVIQDYPIRKVLFEEGVNVAKELYISITLDRENRGYLMLASTEGGIDIEEVAKKSPEKIIRLYIDDYEGLRDYMIRGVAQKLGLEGSAAQDFVTVARAMYKVFTEYDAELVEINPLALTADGQLMALDVKVMIDDNSLFRHPDISVEDSDYTMEELEARKYGLHYVELTGYVGIMANGAGLTMATMDLVKEFGHEPADFLDVGGGASEDSVKEGLKMLLTDDRIKAVLVNIFGGITRCDEVAKGVVSALNEVKTNKPIFIRLKGTNEEEGKKILAEVGLKTYETAEEAMEALSKAITR
ncbi:ADP-forming succinate--CoA ligase subunit beta [Vulcanisaeta souniana]|uniref:Succinate--CoA ligase [ADP-forming] subunit beta n=2 Tax=Vulcanisaeta souniana TaxID=164452 RepID=A0A830E767_9CREN|nr:ADP-forming succinate--CoA ligase subunit beta [Vulcanisaeta souniana]BDR91851.1 succinate--CoA ligase subunit beta [Vulcanisaeta souniana JCM 11219]GGI69840.1 succinate--CoA ligase subunit beta [Vulcanisaeta souniana JCM 11219]